MMQKQQAPITRDELSGARLTVRYKGKKISLSKLQRAVFIILSNGGKYSSFTLIGKLKMSDPRKEIHYLRGKGINVCDEWVEAAPDYARHKLYFINSKECFYE